jgi:hypothetical protein
MNETQRNTLDNGLYRSGSASLLNLFLSIIEIYLQILRETVVPRNSFHFISIKQVVFIISRIQSHHLEEHIFLIMGHCFENC